jgi:hypothetical protein
MWQKLIAASTENAVVAACCEVVDAVDALTGRKALLGVREA